MTGDSYYRYLVMKANTLATAWGTLGQSRARLHRQSPLSGVTARQASESDLGTRRHWLVWGAGQRVGCEEGRVRLRPLEAAQGLTRCSCSSCRVCGSPRRPGAPRHILHSDPDGQCRWVSVGAEGTPVSPVDLIWALTPSARACRGPTPGRVGTARHSRDSCPFRDAPG